MATSAESNATCELLEQLADSILRDDDTESGSAVLTSSQFTQAEKAKYLLRDMKDLTSLKLSHEVVPLRQSVVVKYSCINSICISICCTHFRLLLWIRRIVLMDVKG